jgi:uncharacterized protein (DUF2249 family)
MMPVRLIPLDLREPLADKLMRAVSALENMEVGETLLLELDRDPQPLLKELQPILEKGFEFWVVEEGPEIWRVLITREESF